MKKPKENTIINGIFSADYIGGEIYLSSNFISKINIPELIKYLTSVKKYNEFKNKKKVKKK